MKTISKAKGIEIAGREVPEPKLSTTEIVFGTIIVLLIDMIGFLLLWLAMDDFLMLDLLMIVNQTFLWMKGVAGFQKLIIPVVIEAIPYVGALPIYTIAWMIIVWADSHPESAIATAQKVGGFLGKK